MSQNNDVRPMNAEENTDSGNSGTDEATEAPQPQQSDVYTDAIEISRARKIHALLDPIGSEEEAYAESHWASKPVVFLSFSVITLSVVVLTVESLPEFYDRDLFGFFLLEAMCVGWFTLEVFIKVITCESLKQFSMSFMNWVDVVAIVPFYLDIVMRITRGENGGAKELIILRVIRLTRIFRVFKLSKYNEGVQVVMTCLASSTDALSLLFFLMTLTTVLFGSGIYFAEQTAAYWDEEKRKWIRKTVYGGPKPHPFESIPMGFWWCLETVTTVGFGDIVPVTLPGYCIGILAMLVGLLIVAFPIIMIGSRFTEVRDQFRKRKKMAARIARKKRRERAERCGEGVDSDASTTASFVGPVVDDAEALRRLVWKMESLTEDIAEVIQVEVAAQVKKKLANCPHCLRRISVGEALMNHSRKSRSRGMSATGMALAAIGEDHPCVDLAPVNPVSAEARRLSQLRKSISESVFDNLEDQHGQMITIEDTTRAHSAHSPSKNTAISTSSNTIGSTSARIDEPEVR